MSETHLLWQGHGVIEGIVQTIKLVTSKDKWVSKYFWRLKIKERTLWTLFLNISFLFNWLSSHVRRQHDHRFGGGIIAQKEQRCVERSTWTKERVRLWEIQKRNTHRRLNGREQTGDTNEQIGKELNILFRKPSRLIVIATEGLVMIE